MTNYVPNYEELHYQVHPSQLGWAMHQLSSVPNYNVLGYAPVAGGMCIIVVQAPVGTPQVDWRAPVQQRRRRWPRFDWPRIGRGLALAVVAVALAYIAYGLFVDAASQPAAQTTQAEPSLWDRIADALPHGEPVVEHTTPAIELPWDVAGRQVGEAVDAVGHIVTTLVVLVLLGGIAFVAFKVRRTMRK